jgi:hypothetical protein
MAVTTNRVFMYGYFRAVSDIASAVLQVLGSPREPDIAIEVLREFGAMELVGKLFIKSAGGWQLMTSMGVINYTWYKDFTTGKAVQFMMQGSDPWDVLFFRPESDETGPYVAVGLKLALHGRT